MNAYLLQTALGALVLLPLVASGLSLLVPEAARRWVGVLTAAALLVPTAAVVTAVTSGQIVDVALGGYAAPLGIHLRADGLSAAFLSLSAVVGAVVSAYAALMPQATGESGGEAAPTSGSTADRADRGDHTDRGDRTDRTDSRSASSTSAPAHASSGNAAFWPLWLGAWAGLHAVFVSGDLFNTYVGLELVGLTAVALVAIGGSAARRAALRYLFIAVLGSLLFLVGVALIVHLTGTLDIVQAADRLAPLLAEEQSTAAGGQPQAGLPEGDQAVPGSAKPAVMLAMVLLTAGLTAKIALMPLHRWLIPAHAGAPGAVSPLMSALVIKAALFVLLRCWFYLVDPTALHAALPWLLCGMGVLAVSAGSVLALRQDRLKPLIAYSTVAQVGYWFLLMPLLADPASGNLEDQPGTALEAGQVVMGGLSGVVALALGHGLAKGALFLAAGHLKELYGTDEISALSGAGRRHPMLVMSMGLSAVGLVGVPISLSFAGKWQLATSAVAAGQYWLLAVLLCGTLLAAGYMVRIIAPLLIQREEETEEDSEQSIQAADEDARDQLRESAAVRNHPDAASWAPLILGLLTVGTGFAGVWLNGLLDVGAPW